MLKEASDMASIEHNYENEKFNKKDWTCEASNGCLDIKVISGYVRVSESGTISCENEQSNLASEKKKNDSDKNRSVAKSAEENKVAESNFTAATGLVKTDNSSIHSIVSFSKSMPKGHANKLHFEQLNKFLVSFFQTAIQVEVSFKFQKDEFDILKSIFIRKYKKWIFKT
jgi:hypothetical protein